MTRTIGAAVLVLAACTGQAVPPPTTEDATTAQSFLALGDSYTIGEGVAPAERWPALLAGLMAAEGIQLTTRIIARTGWTTDELDAAIDEADPQGPFDLVTLMVGVNDQFRGYGVDGFRTRFAALVDRAIGLAGEDPGVVIVLTIPDWGVTPAAPDTERGRIAAEIDAFNAVVEEEARARGVAVVDVTTISRRAGSEPGLVADDGLHPSAEMHTEWARLMVPAVAAALG